MRELMKRWGTQTDRFGKCSAPGIDVSISPEKPSCVIEEGVNSMWEMKHRTCLAACVVMLVAIPSWVHGQSGSVSLGGQDYEVVRIDDMPAAEFQPVPEGTPFQRVWVTRNGSTSSVVAGEPTAVEVYQSVDGPIFATNGVNRLLADDIETTAIGGCDLQTLDVGVFRPGSAPAPAGFTVTQLSIWDRCPGAPGAIMLLDLLDGTPEVLPSNGAFLLTIDLTGAEEPIPATFWLAIAFNKADAGWIGGAAPAIGFSQNVLHVDNPAQPALRCNAVFLPSPTFPDLYSAMYADIFCINVAPSFVGYRALVDSAVFYGGPGCISGGIGGCGDGIDINIPCEVGADSIQPIVNNCQLAAYSVNFAGLGRCNVNNQVCAVDEDCPIGQTCEPQPYDVEFELWTDDRSEPTAPRPGDPIPGTRGCFHGVGNALSERASFTFDGSTTLPERFWIVWVDNSDNAGPIAAGGPADVGTSEEFFVASPPNGGGFVPSILPDCPSGGSDCGNFQIVVSCLGEEPTGACCDRASGTCMNGTFNRECPRTTGRWLAFSECESNPFDPPCGQAACCKVDPNNSEATICENQLPTECVDNSGEVTLGLFCSEVEDCGIPACIGAQGDCQSPHLNPGCSDNLCCNSVCQTDEFCCTMEWDDNCTSLANEVCTNVPPSNNNCLDAATVDVGTTQYNTLLATTDGPVLPESCSSGSGASRLVIGKDIWYRYMPAASGILTIGLCSDTTVYDSRIAVYEGCDCPPLMIAGCDDDSCNLEFRSQLEVFVQGDICYLIRVGGWGEGAAGRGAMELSFEGEFCTPGTVQFSDPHSGAVDARRPHPLNSQLPREGVAAIQVTAPQGAPSPCFVLCETDNEGSDNGITNVNENPPGTYTLTLARTLSVGAVTTIEYGANGAAGVFTSQPGNVNGVGGVNAADLTALVNCLNGVDLGTNCPHGPLSYDLDYSGAMGPLDLMLAVDLQNGANTFEAANGAGQPSQVGCP